MKLLSGYFCISSGDPTGINAAGQTVIHKQIYPMGTWPLQSVNKMKVIVLLKLRNLQN